jgi:hypothetical protein
MVDLKRYSRLLPTGACFVKKEGDNITVLFKRFDNETGVELSPEPNYTTKSELLKEKDSLQNQLDAVNSILVDIEKL